MPKLWDPGTGTFTDVPPAGVNIFCSGHAFLPDGSLLQAGGHKADYQGLNSAYTYKPSTNSWTGLPVMINARWYPTATTLPSGEILVISGDIDTSTNHNTVPQVWGTAAGKWRNLPQLDLPFYPYMFVAPNGKVFYAGPTSTTRYLDVSGTSGWSLAPNSGTRLGKTRNWGSAVMYDDGKVLLMGGTTCNFYQPSSGPNKCTNDPTNTAETIDLNSSAPTWNYTTNAMAGGRKLFDATLLPDGTVLVTGGSRSSETPTSRPSVPALEAELWDPVSGTWSTMANEPKIRAYHGIALLLPDGRVLSGGGNPDTGGGASAEIYSPPYLFNGSRPAISSAPLNVAYGQSFFVSTPDATSISKVTMLALGSVTHGFNMGQRISRPAFSQVNGGLNVTAPPAPPNPKTTPPGYYMLFILNSGGVRVPSVAKIIQLSPATSPPKLSTLSDDFNDNNLNSAKWTKFQGSNYTVAETNGQLQVTDTVNTSNSGGISSNNVYDATNSELRINLVQPGNSINQSAVFTWIKLKKDGSNAVEIGVNGGNLYAKKFLGGAGTVLQTASYSSSGSPRWLRIRESNNVTYWEYALSNTNGPWTALYSASDPVVVSSVSVELGLGAWPGTAGTMILDNVNTAP